MMGIQLLCSYFIRNPIIEHVDFLTGVTDFTNLSANIAFTQTTPISWQKI